MLNMDVFCSFLISGFPDKLFKFCLSNFDLVIAAAVITGINVCFYIPHSLIIIVGGVSKIFVGKLPSFSLPAV